MLSIARNHSYGIACNARLGCRGAFGRVFVLRRLYACFFSQLFATGLFLVVVLEDFLHQPLFGRSHLAIATLMPLELAQRFHALGQIGGRQRIVHSRLAWHNLTE